MKTVLAVDDSITMRQMVTFSLGGAGYRVIEASDGDEALEIAKRQAVDLVITDLNMPRMDGITLIRELRALVEHRCTPIVMLTTESAQEKKVEGQAAGATGWIVKPFQPEQIVKVVKRVLA
ncbi:MAG TPA: response regulator [Gemmatimonadaceae bacterium]|nr:response regulator [Gemmatimonadaceae bacterium]